MGLVHVHPALIHTHLELYDGRLATGVPPSTEKTFIVRLKNESPHPTNSCTNSSATYYYCVVEVFHLPMRDGTHLCDCVWVCSRYIGCSRCYNDGDYVCSVGGSQGGGEASSGVLSDGTVVVCTHTHPETTRNTVPRMPRRQAPHLPSVLGCVGYAAQHRPHTLLQRPI